MPFALKLIFAFVPKDNLFFMLLAIVLLPFLLLSLFFSGPAVLAKHVPLVTPIQARYYFDGAKSVSDMTKSPCDEGVNVNWQEVIAIDSVRLKQSFKKSNSERAHDLARMFVYKTGECTYCVGEGEKRTCTTYPVFGLLTMDEVMNELGFSNKQKAEARDFLITDLSFLLDEGTGLPDNWIPRIGPMDWPALGFFYVSSGFGTRSDPFTGEIRRHTGVDIAGDLGVPVVAANDGIVISAGSSGGYGKLIIVDHGNGLNTYYAHLDSINVKTGQGVRKGMKIGEIGSTGRSTGPHLHFEVRVNGNPDDPLTYYK